MDNFLVSASNLYALRAIVRGVHNRRWLDVAILTGAAMASAVYHMIEVSKHDMSGTFFARYEKSALMIDRVLAFAATIRFLISYRTRITRRILCIGIVGLVCLMLSECQHVVDIEKYISPHAKSFYILTHIIWHIGAFHVAYLLLPRGCTKV